MVFSVPKWGGILGILHFLALCKMLESKSWGNFFRIDTRGNKHKQCIAVFSVEQCYAFTRVLISVGSSEDVVVMNFKSVR